MKKSERIKEAIKLMTENCNNKYFDLVWYARSNASKHTNNVNTMIAVIENQKRIEKEYPEEVDALSKDDNWSHGFNSGMLAASRLYLGMIEESVEDAILEFPCLDS